MSINAPHQTPMFEAPVRNDEQLNLEKGLIYCIREGGAYSIGDAVRCYLDRLEESCWDIPTERVALVNQASDALHQIDGLENSSHEQKELRLRLCLDIMSLTVFTDTSSQDSSTYLFDELMGLSANFARQSEGLLTRANLDDIASDWATHIAGTQSGWVINRLIRWKNYNWIARNIYDRIIDVTNELPIEQASAIVDTVAPCTGDKSISESGRLFFINRLTDVGKK